MTQLFGRSTAVGSVKIEANNLEGRTAGELAPSGDRPAR
jgi:hypothetical protein